MRDPRAVLLTALVLGVPPFFLLLLALLPTWVERAEAVVQARPWRAFGLGLLNLAFFFVLGLLVATEITPLAVIGAISFIILSLLLLAGLLIAAVVAGRQVLRRVAERRGTPLGALLLGLLLCYLSLFVPILGWLLVLGLVAAGLGGVILALVPQPAPTETE